MPESGFAPAASAGAVAREEAAPAPAVEPPVAETSEELLSRVTDLLNEQVSENFGGNLVEKFLEPDARATIVRSELAKLLTNEMSTLEGTECPEALKEHIKARVESILTNTVVYDALHETHNRAIREAVASQLSTQLDPSIDTMMFESADRIRGLAGEGHEKVNACMNTHAHYLTFLDMVVRKVYSKLSSYSAPSSITFEPKSVDAPSADGIKVVCLWTTGGRSNGSRALQNGQHIVMQAFPWIGRSALMLPEDADQEMKDLVFGRRRLYTKAIIAAIAPTTGS